MYKDLLCVQIANTLSLREIHLSNVLLNYLKCLYIFCYVDVLLPDRDMFESMKKIKENAEFDFFSSVLCGLQHSVLE